MIADHFTALTLIEIQRDSAIHRIEVSLQALAPIKICLLARGYLDEDLLPPRSHYLDASIDRLPTSF